MSRAKRKTETSRSSAATAGPDRSGEAGEPAEMATPVCAKLASGLQLIAMPLPHASRVVVNDL